MIFEEMVKIKREEIDNSETNKMFNAIHRQAYYRRLEDENKRMLAKLARAEKAAKKQERKEAIIERVKEELFTAAMLIMISPLFFVLFILAIK